MRRVLAVFAATVALARLRAVLYERRFDGGTVTGFRPESRERALLARAA